MKFDVLSVPDRMTLFPPSFSGLLRGKELICTDRIILMSFFFIFFVASPPFLSASLFSFFPFFLSEHAKVALHAYKAVGVHALEEKHGGAALPCLKECLKRQ